MSNLHPLAVARFLRGITQEELADRAGLVRESVNLIETGKRSPRLDTLTRLADALDLDVAAILPGPITPERLAALAPSSAATL